MLEKYGFKKIYPNNDGPTVVCGMSGGVDSSVSAYILKWQGYNVIGLFMKNWEEITDTGFCTAEADFNDVKRVCESLEIPYYAVNFSKQYMDNVFKQFLLGLEKGFTPNPDILCNREIKFGPFLEYAQKIGAEYIATGHYARVNKSDCLPPHAEKQDFHDCVEKGNISHVDIFLRAEADSRFCSHKQLETVDGLANGGYQLMKGIDDKKDQSYFLCALNQEQLSKVIFPIGGIRKEQVREIAAELGLVTAKKKDSTGICFIGERKFRDFMKDYFGNQSGEIRTLQGKTIGQHNGLMYYTLGQRKGLGIGGMKDANDDRWFVVDKDLQNNVLVVNNGECEHLFTEMLVTDEFNFIPNKTYVNAGFKYTAKTRYRQPDQECEMEVLEDGKVKVMFKKPQRAVTPGQWVVLYDGDKCLGGGVILPKGGKL